VVSRIRRTIATVSFPLMLGSALSLGGREAAAETDVADAGSGGSESTVFDYLDSSSDGLTAIELPGSAAPSVTSVDVATPVAVTTSKPAEWLAVPIPSYSPTLGFMITGMAAYIFPADAASPPSTVGAFGMYSTNNSWAVGGIAKLNLAEDRYRVLATLVFGQINWDYYGVGTEAGDENKFVPISQKLGGGRLESLFRLAQGLYLGPRWTLMKINATADLSAAQIPPGQVPPPSQLDSWFSAPGLKFQWDTRDSQFFPRRGQLMEVTADVHLQALGDSFDYFAGKFAWNQYVALNRCQVLAFREVVSFVAGDAPFYALPRLGQGPDIRGFKAGEYQDNILLATQVEYRLQILAWLGAVAFFGIGEVEPNLESLTFKDLLPAGGIGARLTVAPANHVNARVDVAFSREGVTLYLSIGEAF
jgi:hypothetical protein